MWIVLSLISAIFDALRLSINKFFGKSFDTLTVAFELLFCMLPFMAVFAFFTFKSVPVTNINFLITVFVAVLAYTSGLFLLIEATKRTDLSIVAPIVALTPVFILVWEFILFGTLPSVFGLIGILLIVSGSYLLNFSKIKTSGLIAPFKAILRKDEGLIPLLIAVIFSIGATGDKLAVSYTDVYSYASIHPFVAFLFGSIYIFIIRRKKVNFDIFKKPLWVFAHGASLSIMFISNILALAFASASYVIAMKRTSALFGVIFGGLFFKEKGIRERFLGAMVILSGIVVLSFLG